MPTVIDGTLGVDKIKDGSVVQADLATPVRSTGGTAAVAAGLVGEILTANGGVVGITTAVGVQIGSIVLPAGVWDVEGMVSLTGTGCALQRTQAGVSTVSASVPATSLSNQYNGTWNSASTGPLDIPARVQRIILPSGGTVYLNAYMYFSAGTMTSRVESEITARRVA